MKTMSKITYPALALFAITCFALSPKAGAECREGCNNFLFNTFLGESALLNNTTGFSNTAIGYQALTANTTNGANTATGFYALRANTTGYYDTANGSDALRSNTTGTGNTATGATALYKNTAGNNNTANGGGVLFKNTTGNNNTANGYQALSKNTAGNSNTAIGDAALEKNSNGSDNIALGSHAGFNLTTGSNNIDVGNRGVAEEANTIRIGTIGTQTAAYVAGISGTVVVGDAVVVDGNGQIGTVASSQRFKTGIRPMDTASEAVLALKPVTFHYKKQFDPNGIPQFGLVAEEVEKVDPDLVARDRRGKPYTVRYEAVNAMLLNEFLKEHRKVEQQQKQIDALETELKEQKALIQKVSNQLDLTKPAPLTVVSSQ
jgi:trimeric autotransporter adhesin